MFRKLLTWREIPIAASVTKPGSSIEYKTRGWRTLRPIKDEEKCNKCGFCWIFCPEGAIELPNYTINYDYCKGCGICARECPVKAIIMEEER
jgi:pyruvate ferredoxin oxidoreductase delta subunit